MTVPGSNLMMKMSEVLATRLVLTTVMIFAAADKGGGRCLLLACRNTHYRSDRGYYWQC